ncbi:UDP-N-acetylmuramoyl-tripeptide--D-alanyl-D-alanine ligase [Thalassotalea sp. LPB0316]|uniref:UDP-N-acetylmuramoyl-tripeptide--D-alanyl-D- alanine ligase n=1 Tax=Thalassotalea sp. LPB0316 TaxID=2769490 RepID=UPI0018663350|nr:UDP-N-acetylmuramoyl-tripeptide--D-alanyl-D-alanine ligase [Thalassotalea sp. LPB0316]QOL25906.1 UDP-N-acetylmuramoyl-tripeptide--D-alanyl-D-alanine ligase [Thalassotalea sp. LPB0316]
MIPLSLATLGQITEGRVIAANKDCQLATINSIVTDSRELAQDDVFLALKGPNFDGHKFCQQALEKGCQAVIVSEEQAIDIAQVVVEDTRIALGKIGAYIKAQVAPKTVAITGSSGKTTVKEMVYAILSRLGNVLATNGNFNNDIGVPLTLMRLDPSHDYAVIELGANHLGEIAYTTNLTKPDVAVINNIAAAHLEGFGDLCGVARAKGEIFDGLEEGGIAIYNQDTPYAGKWQWRLTDKNVLKVSCNDVADFYPSDVVLDDNGCASFKLHTPTGASYIELPIPGKHNVCNALMAAAIALQFGASVDDIRLGLIDMVPAKGRLNVHTPAKGFKLIDDSYNANVESVKAATQLLANLPGKRVLVLGDMGELGQEARQYHHEVGAFAKSLAIDGLFTLGVLSQSASQAFGDNGFHFNDRASLMASLKQYLSNEEQSISVLVKGSRSARMELVVQDVLEWQASTSKEHV